MYTQLLLKFGVLPCLFMDFMDIQKEVMLQVTNGKKVLNLAKVAPPVRIHMNTGKFPCIALCSRRSKARIQSNVASAAWKQQF